ncbi:MAG: hypothetical protein QF441_16530 [Bacteriovoracaceae bacterium]|jgi:hypothetical protein|nr:hypothetical protein [Bacteriovoracaceae bacterium]|tara:strand:+ start:319 stop:480 length:162 start_codon:yes stop_codon:yes gene_type:complete
MPSLNLSDEWLPLDNETINENLEDGEIGNYAFGYKEKDGDRILVSYVGGLILT